MSTLITYSWPSIQNTFPEDPQVLQQMVLDLMAQLDRECSETK